MAFRPSQQPASKAASVRVLIVAAALGLCAPMVLAQTEVGHGVSNIFTADTHWNGWPGDLGIEHVSSGESNVFPVNTTWNSWPGGLLRHKEGSAESPIFAVNVTEPDYRVSGESAVFTVDTRMPTFQLQGGVISWLDSNRIALDLSVNNISNSSWPIKVDVTFQADGVTYFAPENDVPLRSFPGVANVPREVRLDSLRSAAGDPLPRGVTATVSAQLREGIIIASPVTVIGALVWQPVAESALEITNVLAEEQGPDTFVIIDFNYQDSDNVPIQLGLAASSDGGITWHLIPVSTVTGLARLETTALPQAHRLVWAVGVDWPDNFTNRLLVQVVNRDNGDGAIGGPITVDTRSAFLASEVTSPYSSNTRPAIFIDDVPFDVTFSVDPEWGSRTPGHIEFHTPHGVYSQPADQTSRTFNMGAAFGPGGRLRVILVDDSGNASGSVDANITVVEPPMGIAGGQMQVSNTADGASYTLRDDANFAFTILDEATATVDDDVPGFTDHEIGFEPLKIPAPNLVIDSGGIATVHGSHTGTYHAAGQTLDVDLGVDLIFHYANGWQLDRGDATVAMDDSIIVAPGPAISPAPSLPNVFRLGGELAGNFSIPLTVGDADGGQLNFATSFASLLTGKWAAGGEIQHGISYETALGVEAEIQYDLPPNAGRGASAVSLVGILRQNAMGYQTVQTIWTHDWFENAAGGGARELGADGNWNVFSRSYLPLRGQIPADPGAISAIGGQRSTFGFSVYPYSQPTLATSGNETMLLWVQDDGTRNDRDRTSVMWRIHKNGSWSSDTQLQIDGTADFTPTVSASDSGFIAAWESMNRTFSDFDDLDDLIAAQEIIAGRYNSNAGAWAIDRITNDNVLDRSPVLSVSGDNAVLLWVRNNGNHLVGTQANPNVLMFSFYTPANGWSSPGGIASNVPPVLNISVAWNGSTAHAFYTIDEDFDMRTDTDREIYGASFNTGIGWSALIPLTNNTVPDTNPQASIANDSSLSVYWHQSNRIMHSDSSLLANSQTVVQTSGVSGAEDFVFTQAGDEKALVWGGSVPGGQQIIASIFDSNDNEWLAPTPLTGGGPIARSPAAVFDKDGILRVVYNQVPVLPTDFGIFSPISDGVVEVNEPDFRAVQLVELTQTNRPDLQITDIGFAPQPIPGSNSTVTAIIANNGHADVESSFTVRFFDNDPNSGGALIGIQNVASLARAASTTVTADWSVPASSSSKTIHVIVDQTDQIIEQSETNNVGTASGVVSDLRISQIISSYNINGAPTVTVEVTNDGLVSVPSFRISARDTTPDGAEIAQANPTINGSATIRVTLTLSDRIATTAAIVLDPDNNIPEADETNNVAYAHTNLPIAPRPSITPQDGLLAGHTFVQIITSVPGGDVRYTLDGSLPTLEDTAYTGPIFVDSSVHVRARVFAPNRQPSDVASANYLFANDNLIPRITDIAAAPTGDNANAALLTATVTDIDNQFGLLFLTWTAPDHPGVTFDENTNGTSSANNMRVDFPGPGTYRLELDAFDIIDRVQLSVFVEVPIDSDADLLADHWEITHFGDLSEGRDDDPDNDNLSNYAEFIAGSDPGGDFEVIFAAISPGTADVLPSRSPTVAEVIPVNENSTQVFSVTPDRGTPPYTFEWSRDGQPFPGGTQSSYSFSPAYTDIAHPAQSGDSVITCIVRDTGSQIVATATWQVVRVLDVDQLAPPPIGVSATPLNPLTSDDLALSGGALAAADPDGDIVLGIAYDWQLLPATIDGPNLPAGSTRKGQVWQGHAYAQTDPYGLGVVANRPAIIARTIGNTSPVGVAKSIPIDIDTPIQIVLAANDQDVTDGADSLTYSIITPPQHGTLTNFDPATGRVIYTVDRREALHDNLVFTARDEDGAVTQQTNVALELGWRLPIDVTNGHVDELLVGIHRDATADFDFTLDEITPTDLGGKARVSIDGQPDNLRVDIRAIAESVRWTTLIENAIHAVDVTLSWDPALLPDSGLFLFQTDEGGDPLPNSPIIDMRGSNQYVIPAGENQVLAITYREVTFDLTLRPGWNLVSMPVIPLHDVPRTFGHLHINRAFAWDGSNFSAATQLEVGHGYFIFHRGPTTTTVTIRGATSLDSLHPLSDNWNLAGPIADPPFAPVPLANTLSPIDRLLQGQIWSWNARSRIYLQHPGDLIPGDGYWMFVFPDEQ